MLTGLLLATVGCDDADARRADLPGGTRTLENRLDKPGMSLRAIGDLANELGERYEDIGDAEQAAQYYRQAVWAYGHSAYLLGRTPPLLEDARYSLRRVEASQPSMGRPAGGDGQRVPARLLNGP